MTKNIEKIHAYNLISNYGIFALKVAEDIQKELLIVPKGTYSRVYLIKRHGYWSRVINEIENYKK